LRLFGIVAYIFVTANISVIVVHANPSVVQTNTRITREKNSITFGEMTLPNVPIYYRVPLISWYLEFTNTHRRVI